MISFSCTAHIASNDDPLQFRANPANLVSKVRHCIQQLCMRLRDVESVCVCVCVCVCVQLDEEEKDQSDESAADEEGTKLYVPPRVAPMPYGQLRNVCVCVCLVMM